MSRIEAEQLSKKPRRSTLGNFRGRGWRWARRVTQWVVLVVFFYLFRHTQLTLDPPPEHANIFFRLDPLVAASAMLAGKAMIAGMLMSLIVIAATLLLGRVFCGWFCPLGTLLDTLGPALRVGKRNKENKPASKRWWRGGGYALLTVLLIGAVLGLPLVGFFDPFAILMRGAAFAIDPLLSWSTYEGSSWLYLNAPESVTGISEPIYAFMRDNNILAFERAAFIGAWISAGFLLVIFLLERVEKRFWCRNLCPLGAMLGLFARLSPMRRKPDLSCPGCGDCMTTCRMGAFNEAGKLEPQACTLCMDCASDCTHGIAAFAWRRPAWLNRRTKTNAPRTIPLPIRGQTPSIDLSRRAFLGSCATGIALPLVSAAAMNAGLAKKPKLLRPAGSVSADEFLNRCIRCGQCMKVCPTNGLQPTILEAGLAGMFSPQLIPRRGCCEWNCNLCGQVCPTAAIALLPLETKQTIAIGRAEFDKDRCIPYADRENCLVCEEHCPVPDKAIRLSTVMIELEDGQSMELQEPFVEPDLCIGCGICENVCPLEGAAGVRVSPL
ncbi:MAG: 4Fe-4S binding protein [Phycisphaeraceae bacterium]|nr:4Fe-4S binding protein [Phycisphaeraceae bacterium]